MAQNPTLLGDMVKGAASFGKPFDRFKAEGSPSALVLSAVEGLDREKSKGCFPFHIKPQFPISMKE
jgi:hypothetical protein